MMLQKKQILIFIFISGMFMSCQIQQEPEISLKWTKIPSAGEANSPYACGVAAAFAGIYNNYLLFGGGCNFPDIPLVLGGSKQFYDDLFIRQIDDTLSGWTRAGKLPQPTAYGVSVSTPAGIVCVGGCNSEEKLSSAYLITIDPGKDSVTFVGLPSFPETVDNATGTYIDDRIYIVCGNMSGKPSSKMYVLSLKNIQDGWEESVMFPGGARVQPTACRLQQDNETGLFLAGGFRGAFDTFQPEVFTDAYYFSPREKSWIKLSDPLADSQLVSLGGGVSVPVGDSLALCMGGVNKDKFLGALRREQKASEAKLSGQQEVWNEYEKQRIEYISRPSEWHQFNRKLMLYHMKTNTWTVEDSCLHTALAGAVAAYSGNIFFVLNGEIRAGVRTPDIWEGTFLVKN